MRESGPPIFISYSIEDSEKVQWLSEALRNLDHNVWVDKEQITGGHQKYNVIQEALDECEVMLLVVSSHGLQSKIVYQEWVYFYCERQKKLIPLIFEPLEPPAKLNFMLASLQSIDFWREDRENATSALHHTLQAIYTDLHPKTTSSEVAALSYRTPSLYTRQDELSATKAGVINAHLGMPLELFVDWIWNAKSTIRVLNTWTGIFYGDPSVIIEAIKRGCNFQILLLDPSSAFAKQRSIDIHLDDKEAVDENEVPKNILTSIRHLASLYQELNDAKGRMELRLYNVLPSFSVHQCDNRALIGFFPHSERTTAFPMLQVEMQSPFGLRFNEEFEAIWNTATVIDLSPTIAPRIAAANQTLAEPLSARELEILAYICRGLSNQEIAQKLVVTLATVKKHINNLYSKLNVTSRTRAVLLAQELGLV